MARNNAFDPMAEEEDLDADALMAQLGETPPTTAPTSTAPTSNTMPIGASPAVTPAPTTTPTTTAPTGFAARRVAPAAGGPPAGFDARNWADDGMQSVKYRAGRLLNGVNKPSEMAARVQSEEFQRAFPGATFDGKDRINFQGALSDGESGVPVFDIDVLQQADAGSDSSNGFWWGHDVPGMNQGPSAPGATSAPGTRIDTLSPARPSPETATGTPQPDDPMAAIMAEIEALQNGGASPMDQQALMQLLGI